MKTLKTAVVTTCEQDYQRYFKTQPKEIQKTLEKVSVLRDIKMSEYNKSVMLIESKNVTNKVIKEVQKKSLFVEDLSHQFIYE